MRIKEKIFHGILHTFGETVTSPADLVGDAEPSLLFYLFARRLAWLFSDDSERIVSEKGIRFRRGLNVFLKRIGKLFLEHRQVLESKNALLGINEPDAPAQLPKEPVIWCANHSFKDDITASILVIRHSYILFGSLPMFFNSFEGLSSFLNGVILCNRKIARSRHLSVDNAVRALNMGTDLLIFPEGVWNKTPDKLILHLWPGIYRIAKQTGSKVVPVIHYLADPHKKEKGNVIHTLIADPISMEGLSEEEGLTLLRDTMASWYYLMMERYGHSTRQELLGEYDTADDAWEAYLAMHTGAVNYYDKEIELVADYRPRRIVRPADVWRPIANLPEESKIPRDHLCYAQTLLAQEERRDFQRRY